MSIFKKKAPKVDPIVLVEEALRKGKGLHAFLSGGGLRVVRIEDKGRGTLRGYGEHPHIDEAQRLDEMLAPAGSKLLCVSSFGVYDMVGNIDEFVINETGQPYVSGLMSGHVFGVRNACRPMTEAHGPGFGWYETGGRCCRDTPQ